MAWSRNGWWAFVESGSIPANFWSTNCLVCWRKKKVFGIACEKHYLKYFPGMCSSHAWAFHWPLSQVSAIYSVGLWVLFVCLFCFWFFFPHKGSRNIKKLNDSSKDNYKMCHNTETNSDCLYHKAAQCSLNHSSTLRWEQGAGLFCIEHLSMQEWDCDVKFWKDTETTDLKSRSCLPRNKWWRDAGAN